MELSPVLAEVKVGEEESIDCPHCDGEGYTTEVDMTSDGQSDPYQCPCGYCYCAGRITTKMMKEHIAQSRNHEIDDDELPF